MVTGKSVSEALILESVKPQYDERLFIEFQEKYKLTTCCVQKLFFCFCFDIQNNICTQHVVNLYFSWNSMNNLSSYCGLTDARMRASEKDFPLSLQESNILMERPHIIKKKISWIATKPSKALPKVSESETVRD